MKDIDLAKYGFEKLVLKDGESAPTVVVGLSGGVDSSVVAYILKWQGYRVIGVFMKNWEEKDDMGFCTSDADFEDVKRVAEYVDIPYYAVNFSKQYMDQVFKEFLHGLEMGYTPNPDILCNREVKFGPFLEYALGLGADYVATGHYARRQKHDVAFNSSESEFQLLKGLDESKDQSYFLCGLSQSQLRHTMFPIGGIKKEQVREIARGVGIPVATKKDSTGICFIGERKFTDFLKGYFGNQAGDIETTEGRKIGRHIGLMYYTIGQKKGLGVGGVSGVVPHGGWYVTHKSLDDNKLIVSSGDGAELLEKSLHVGEFHSVARQGVTDLLGADLSGLVGRKLNAKVRYRQSDQVCTVTLLGGGASMKVEFDVPQRAITPGQWLVLYDGDVCLGGGMIVG